MTRTRFAIFLTGVVITSIVAILIFQYLNKNENEQEDIANKIEKPADFDSIGNTNDTLKTNTSRRKDSLPLKPFEVGHGDKKLVTIRSRNKVIRTIYLTALTKFKDSIFRRTRDTLSKLNDSVMILRPYIVKEDVSESSKEKKITESISSSLWNKFRVNIKISTSYSFITVAEPKVFTVFKLEPDHEGTFIITDDDRVLLTPSNNVTPGNSYKAFPVTNLICTKRSFEPDGRGSNRCVPYFIIDRLKISFCKELGVQIGSEYVDVKPIYGYDG